MRSASTFRNVVTALTILCEKLYRLLTAYAVSIAILVSIALSDIKAENLPQLTLELGDRFFVQIFWAAFFRNVCNPPEVW